MSTFGELHRGKLARAPRILSVRPLVREDLACLREKRPAFSRIKAFRDTHHRLARLVAAALPRETILRLTGFSSTRLEQLKQDPAFSDLVARYRTELHAAEQPIIDEFATLASENMVRAERMIEAHIDAADESGDLIPLKQLTSIVSDRADRFGYGKRQTTVNVNVGFAARLEKAISASGKSTILEGEVASSIHPAPSREEVETRPSPPAPTPPVLAQLRRL